MQVNFHPWSRFYRPARAARLLLGVLRAARGNPDGLEYLQSDAIRDALEAWRPGAGRLVDLAAGFLAGLESEAGAAPAGEYRAVPAEPPWAEFIARVRRRPWGAHVILGPPGSGKTALALKLAWTWREELGYEVDVVNMYAEDKPVFARTITAETLLKRLGRLRAWLETEAEPDPDEDPDPGRGHLPPGPPPEARVIVVDEAHLGAGASGSDPIRVALRQALTQVRHVRWHLIYISQLAGLLPPSVLAQTIVWVKMPGGREAGADRENRVVRELWERAGEAFAGLKRLPWYAPPYADPRAWAYVDAPELGYTGLVPFTPYRVEAEAVSETWKEGG